jgi:hypothetical protein
MRERGGLWFSALFASRVGSITADFKAPEFSRGGAEERGGAENDLAETI